MALYFGQGKGGELRCGYVVAARFGAWGVTRRGEVGVVPAPGVPVAWHFTGEPVERDDYRLEHSARFDLVLEVGGGRRRWRDVQVHIAQVIAAFGQGEGEEL